MSEVGGEDNQFQSYRDEPIDVDVSSFDGSGSGADEMVDSPTDRASKHHAVTFAMDEEEEDNQQDRLSDQQRSRVELLSKISSLTKALREAERKYFTERERSKKKGKSLVKLAKELKKRSAQKELDADRLEEVRSDMLR